VLLPGGGRGFGRALEREIVAKDSLDADGAFLEADDDAD
jgi:hypothetical protein